MAHLPPQAAMEYDGRGPIPKTLLIIGKQAFGEVQPGLIRFPDGLLAYEHALQTLHSAVPSADTIYISVHDEIQTKGIKSRVDDTDSPFPSHAHSDSEHDHDDHSSQTPKLEIIFDKKIVSPNAGTYSVASLLAAHALSSDAKWLVLGIGYPLLPPPALQQLILEYQDPVTCFVKEDGAVEPLLGIWGSNALERLTSCVSDGQSEADALERVVKDMRGKQVTPLREEWITKPQTKECWDNAMVTFREIKGMV